MIKFFNKFISNNFGCILNKIKTTMEKMYNKIIDELKNVSISIKWKEYALKKKISNKHLYAK